MENEHRDDPSQTGGHSVGTYLEETKISAGKHGRWFYLIWVVVWLVLLAFLLVIYSLLT
ncbi:MAG TPA: hypothetical protein VFD74_01090 [Thermoleophilia bacterium]|nr:hypothetical protein [Thermoleophilia bacterium]